MKPLALWLAAAALSWTGITAAASGDVEMRLRALESRLPDADRMAQLEKSLNSQSASVLAADVEQLKSEIRELRGQIEQLAHEIQKLQQGQGVLYEDLDKRLQRLEARAHTAPSPISEGVPIADSEPRAGNAADAGVSGVVDIGGEQAEYLAAFELLQQGKTRQAVSAFQGFLDRYPQGQYAGNARYWLGEAHYVEKNYPQSLAEFSKLLEQYPGSQKASGALLKIGYIHYETRNFPQARKVLEQITQQYPGTNVSTLAAERLERMRKEGV